jgi:hypothetical protein
MIRRLARSLTTTAATLALATVLAGPVEAQGVPTVDTQNIAQEIRQLQQMLQDFGIQTDLLDNLFGAGRALRPARSSVSPVRAMPDSCCVRAACFLVIHSHPAFPAPDSGERSRTSVNGASAPRATWPV